MALYERYDPSGAKVERAFTVDGSERDAELMAKAAAGLEGWERTAGPGPAPQQQEQGQEGPPPHAATKDVWEAYAVTRGLTAEDAAGITKDKLIEMFGRRRDNGEGSGGD